MNWLKRLFSRKPSEPHSIPIIVERDGVPIKTIRLPIYQVASGEWRATLTREEIDKFVTVPGQYELYRDPDAKPPETD